ncbi:hypothetical protein TPA0910_03060 [Streptomyces hygroscopicus subsp. sporocinereus]|uniref:Uncharacterized protein n=1 Tax=Streptomyces hygroscopicus TaxID=1912 RepID=A0ABQ3TRK0_STRHY|nr:hypothetical protein TPA0910_03060 [Streptomyces hygroscopicus]GLV77736.1 hypothetical protein Shyhy02_57360 [Streptomyces hygroscopicus subsp. hygroscopicus]
MPGSCRRYGRGGADTEDDAAYMGETDPFVCRRIAYAPGPGGGAAPWGMRSVQLEPPPGRVTRSYITPPCGWHTIWRTLANPGE